MPVALVADIRPIEGEIDFSPPKGRSEALTIEIENLRAEVERLTLQNEEWRLTIDSIYASPTAKRDLLLQLEKKYKISRRRACRLLSFARSTCWYRPAAGNLISAEDTTAITALSNHSLIQRLRKLTRQAENGFLPLDEHLQAQFEYGLNRIGLASAAQLSRLNLKLAMEIFTVWSRQPRT